MHLVEIDIVELEPIEAGFDGGRHMLAAQAEAVGPALPRIIRSPAKLGRDDEILAVLALEPAAEDLLGDAAAIDVSGVDEIAAGRDEAVEHLTAQRLSGLAAECHGAKAQLADLETGFAQIAIVHFDLPALRSSGAELGAC